MQIEIRGAERLSFRERQVVTLKELGYNAQAIATKLGISQGTIATLYNRAKTKGYEVVIVISGDPLALFGSGEPEEDSEVKEEE